MTNASDLSIYQDQHFAGKDFIGIGSALIFIIFLLEGFLININSIPLWNESSFVIIFTSMALYLLGYWKAVIDKGYSRILFIAAFSGPIGLVLILFMPNISKRLSSESTFPQQSDTEGTSLREAPDQ